ncbi:TolC family type I secretion outer membrane prot [Pseudomonas putida DOT-T1E]|uniref:TolC family type I secretion outer membrane prot n=1 Tax=Pseudomonas putida (strain DOT-T1E) TaxID=1196325 RepID=I7B244_PSEPT|nr:TolC family type I secretion outer membrane prot [Pseudomonas putida DOT-T1E]
MKRSSPLSPLLLGAFGLLALNFHPVAQAADDIDPHLRQIGPSLLRDAPEAVPARPPIGMAPVASGERLSLTDAVLQAAQWHPSIAEAIGNLYKQGEGINVARAGYYPQISGGLRTGYDTGYGGDRNSQALNLSLKQMLYDFGKVDSAVNAAQAAAARAQANILLVVDDLARDTAYAWIETRRYEQLMTIARDQIRGVGDIAGMARQRSDMGASTRSDVVQAESRVESARATLEEYQSQYERWRSTLAALMGRVTPPALAEGSPAELNQACKRPAQGDDRLPAVLMALAQRAQGQAELAQAKAEAYPTLSLQPQVNHYLDDDYNRDNARLDRTQAGIYLNVEVPIYQGGLHQRPYPRCRPRADRRRLRRRRRTPASASRPGRGQGANLRAGPPADLAGSPPGQHPGGTHALRASVPGPGHTATARPAQRRAGDLPVTLRTCRHPLRSAAPGCRLPVQHRRPAHGLWP